MFRLYLVAIFLLPSVSSQECTFENAFGEPDPCNIQIAGDDLSRWKVHAGPTYTSIHDSGSTGPSVDHTLGTAAGYYLRFDSSVANPDSPFPPPFPGDYFDFPHIASIDVAPNEVEHCLVFYINTYTTSTTYTGRLEINRNDGSVTSALAPAILGSDTDEWTLQRIEIPPSTSATTIQFHGYAGGELEDKGIDDLIISPHPCSNIDDAGNPFNILSEWSEYTPCSGSCGPGQKVRTRTCDYPPCSETVLYEEVLSCNDGCRLNVCPDEERGDCDCNWDEGDVCGVLNPSNTNYWHIGSSTPTEGTGPDHDHTLYPILGGDCGNFIYMDASLMENEGETAYLATDYKQKDAAFCIWFYLFMFSVDPLQMGSFSVYLWQDNKKTIIMAHDGNLQDDWVGIHITVTTDMIPEPSNPFMIVFEGVRGSGVLSDIAIDDVMVRDGECTDAVNGFWTTWSSWTTCSFSCDEGEQSRSRECESPPPSNDGLDCPGESSQTRPCPDLEPCPVTGEWGDFSEWTDCDVTCGNGNKYMYRECIDPKPVGGMEYYCTDGMGNQALTEEIPETCEGATGVCNIDGMWGEWEFMNDCDASCLGGFGTEGRSCNDPEQSGSGNVCVGSDPDYESRSVTCNSQLCPIDGDWSSWSEWTDCVESCGFLEQSRQRSCNDPEPDHGGESCSEEEAGDEDVRSCDIPVSCPIDGEWSGWEESACSETCGSGTYTKTRSCNDPEPEYDGISCDGLDLETFTCVADIAVCPVDGGWSAYVPDACPGACGYSEQTRVRQCNDPTPAGAGADCEGDAVDVVECFDNFCSEDFECAFMSGGSCGIDMSGFTPNRWSVTSGLIDNGGSSPADIGDVTGDGSFIYFETSSSDPNTGAGYTGNEHYFSISQTATGQIACLEFHLYFHDQNTLRPPGNFRVEIHDDGGLLSTPYTNSASLDPSWQTIRVDIAELNVDHEYRFIAEKASSKGDRAVDGIRIVHNVPCNKIDSKAHTFMQ